MTTDELLEALNDYAITTEEGRQDLLFDVAEALARLADLDREAATYVETPIILRTHFTGEPPYVGWKGLGLALTEYMDRMEATPKWNLFTCVGEPELNSPDLQSLAEDWIGLERDDPPHHIYRDLRGPDAWLAWADGKWTAFDTEEEALNARNK